VGSAGGGIRLVDLVAEATFDLPATNVPAGIAVAGQFVLDSGWRRVGGSGGSSSRWRHASPIRLARKRYSAPPRGIRLLKGDRDLPFEAIPFEVAGTWNLSSDAIFVTAEDSPATWPNPPVLHSDLEARLQARLNWGASGLLPAAYVPYSLTLDAITRAGLLLPAPGTASWQLQLPPAAELRLGLAMVPRTVTHGGRSEGARLFVEVNGEVVAQLTVRPESRFQDARVDLSAYGGQNVQVTLRSDPAGSADWDHVFLANPHIRGTPTGTPRRVIMVGIDTLRVRSMTQHGARRDTTAPLDAFAASSVVFDAAYAPAPRTRPSFRTSLTGLQPLAAIGAPTVADAFRAQGFHTAGITANVHLVPRFGFNSGFDYWHYENGADADVQVRRARRWLKDHEHQDSLLFLHLMDPHTFYRAPGRFANRYVETDAGPLDPDLNRWRVMALSDQGRLTRENKQWLQDRYDGEVRYMAQAWVETLPGQTLVVLHSDHGEEFWEHGGYEHNHTLYQELVQGMLWIRPPGGWGDGPHRIEKNVGLVDIVPTLLDLFGMEAPAMDGLSLAPLLDAGRAEEVEGLHAALDARALPIGHLMYDTERWAVVADGHKYILQTMSGEEELYEVATDPLEQRQVAPLYSPVQMDKWRRKLAEATGWPVGAGWRVQISRADTPFTLLFDAPVEGLILDPESSRKRRANLEWGEKSTKGPDDIGTLTRSADGLSLAFTPKDRSRKGTIAIRLDHRGQTAMLRTGDTEQPVEAGATISTKRLKLTFEAGTVILPQNSVRQVLARGQGPEEDATGDSIEALQALGYVE
jgi:arylsulfatase A-like enzyme